jgi:hypothetical protein
MKMQNANLLSRYDSDDDDVYDCDDDDVYDCDDDDDDDDVYDCDDDDNNNKLINPYHHSYNYESLYIQNQSDGG